MRVRSGEKQDGVCVQLKLKAQNGEENVDRVVIKLYQLFSVLILSASSQCFSYRTVFLLPSVPSLWGILFYSTLGGNLNATRRYFRVYC